MEPLFPRLALRATLTLLGSTAQSSPLQQAQLLSALRALCTAHPAASSRGLAAPAACFSGLHHLIQPLLAEASEQAERDRGLWHRKPVAVKEAQAVSALRQVIGHARNIM